MSDIVKQGLVSAGAAQAATTEGAPSPIGAELDAQEQNRVAKREGGSFEIKADGVYLLASGKADRVICGPLRLIAVSMNFQGAEPRAVFELTDLYGEQRTAEIPVTDWTAGVKILRDKCLRIDEPPSRQQSKVADYMQAAFNAKAATLPRLIRADRNGWLGNDFRHFCFNGRILSADGNDGGYVPARLGDDPDFVAQGTLEQWKECVAKPLQYSSRYVMALGAGLAAPLVRVLDRANMSPGLLICGPSSTGKTSLLHAVNTLFGGARLNNWNTTKNSLEALSHQMDSLPLLIDELGQADKGLQDSIYEIGNGVGRGRANPDGTRRSVKTWALTWVSTGEMSAAERYKETTGKNLMDGADIRFVCIPLDGREGREMFESIPPGYDSLRDFMLSWDGERAKYKGTAGPAFLCHLIASIKEQGREAIQSAYESMCAKLEESTNAARAGQEPITKTQARALRCFALYAFAGELGISYGVLPWPAGTAFNACITCFLAWMGREDSPESRLADLFDSLAQPPLERLTRWNAGASNPLGGPSPRDKVATGINWQGELCLVLYEPKMMSDLLKAAGISKKELRKAGVKKYYLLASTGESDKHYGMFRTNKERYGFAASAWLWAVVIPAIKRQQDAAGNDKGDCFGPGPWSPEKAAQVRAILLGKTPEAL